MTVRPGEQLRELAAKATPGPWAPTGGKYGAVSSLDPETIRDDREARGSDHIDAYGGSLVCESVLEEDRALIALAPDLAVLVADLADALEAWDAELSPDCDGPERDTCRSVLARVRELEARTAGVASERQPGA